MLDAKLLKLLSCTKVNNNSFTGPLNIGTFEKLAPGLFCMFFDGVGSGLKKLNFSFGHLRDSAPSNK